MRLLTEYLSTKVKPSTIVAKDNKSLRQIICDELKAKGTGADLNHIDVSEVTDFTRVFYLKDFTGDISTWDMSGAKTTEMMFAGCTHFNPDYLDNFVFKNLEDMTRMFALCYSFEGKGLKEWDVSNVKMFGQAFNACRVFNEDISGWKISPKCTCMVEMFMNTSEFDQDLSSWKISNFCSTTDMFKNSKMNRKHNHFPQRIYK